jgi:hypothetical protein
LATFLSKKTAGFTRCFLHKNVDRSPPSLYSSAFIDSPIAQSVEQRTVNPCVPGSSPGRGAKYEKAHRNVGFFSDEVDRYSPIAQSVEQRTVNPCVPGSSPGRGARHEKAHIAVGFFVSGIHDLQIDVRLSSIRTRTCRSGFSSPASPVLFPWCPNARQSCRPAHGKDRKKTSTCRQTPLH